MISIKQFSANFLNRVFKSPSGLFVVLIFLMASLLILNPMITVQWITNKDVSYVTNANATAFQKHTGLNNTNSTQKSVELKNLSQEKSNETILNDNNISNNNDNLRKPVTSRSTISNKSLNLDCLFDPTLPKCAADPEGKCPEGFATNENDQCFPIMNCPAGYHSVEGDESGRCHPDKAGCPSDMIFNPKTGNCEFKEFVCKEFPNIKECKEQNR